MILTFGLQKMKRPLSVRCVETIGFVLLIALPREMDIRHAKHFPSFICCIRPLLCHCSGYFFSIRRSSLRVRFERLFKLTMRLFSYLKSIIVAPSRTIAAAIAPQRCM